jgi:hypothetical protein
VLRTLLGLGVRPLRWLFAPATESAPRGQVAAADIDRMNAFRIAGIVSLQHRHEPAGFHVWPDMKHR